MEEQEMITHERVIELERDIERAHRALEEMRENRERAQNTYSNELTKIRNERSLLERKLQQEREVIKTALAKVYDGQPEFTLESPEIQAILRKAFRIGKLVGFRSEVAGLAERLGIPELWEDLRELGDDWDDETKRQQIEVAIMNANEIHPLDPRAENVWRKCTAIASSMGLCHEYENVAERLGIPTDFEQSYSGYIEVSFTGYASVPVEGLANRRDFENGYVDFLTDFDVSDYADQVSWEITDTDVSWTDED
jgi:hypothetical protein